MSEYSTVPSTGKLKLKGVKDGRVAKKKKKPKAGEDGIASSVNDNSVVLKLLEDEDKVFREDQVKAAAQNKPGSTEAKVESEEDIREHIRTEAEKRYDEQRKKRLEDRLKKEGVKTHKERVEELNKYLSNLSEHHDMPKIGPG